MSNFQVITTDSGSKPFPKRDGINLDIDQKATACRHSVGESDAPRIRPRLLTV
jgi:hypothetical protein